MEALLPRFHGAHTQVVGVSVDSVYSHANWARDLGGISFPLLADFQPRGALASACGAFLEGAGISDRATVIIDSDGVVRHASSVTPAGQRDPAELAGLCEQIDRDASGTTEPFAAPAGLPSDATLYVKNQCGISRAVLLVRDNLHLPNVLSVDDVERAGGKLNMTEMQMRLLEKIEELTLYTLGPEERLGSLHEVNAELRTRLAGLEELVEELASRPGKERQ